jgi:hypothetical protein
MNFAITSANNFSGQSVVISRNLPVQSAVSVRKPTLNRPFIFPILKRLRAKTARAIVSRIDILLALTQKGKAVLVDQG